MIRLHNPVRKIAAIAVVIACLAIMPAPLLPPNALTSFVQSAFGLGWQSAYLASSVILQVAFYFSLGLIAGMGFDRKSTILGIAIQATILPLAVVGLGLIVRALRAGHFPFWVNAVVPAVASWVGVMIGLTLLYRRWKFTVGIAVVGIAVALWGMAGGVSNRLRVATEQRLRRMVAAGPELPSNQSRFGALLQNAFEPLPSDSGQKSAIDQNRASILALGIAAGHPRVARMVGIDEDDGLVREAVSLGGGTALNGRQDWSRHYALSAALAVLGHPLVSEAGGLMKEQIDALSGGSGFSFGDLTADRAGVRFAAASTQSESAARAMQARLRNAFVPREFFPAAVDFPENLTVEQFHQDFDRVGSPRYQAEVLRIDQLLDTCDALSIR